MKDWYGESEEHDEKVIVPALPDKTGKQVIVVNWGVWIIVASIILGSLIISAAIVTVKEQDSITSGDTPRQGGLQNPTDPGAQPDTALAKDITLPSVTKNDWVRGDRKAKISIIEFSDTECPFCKKIHPTLQKIVSDYKGQVNWVYRHAPLAQLHSKAPKEAEALECAGELNGNEGFWAYLDRLFEVTPANNGLDESELPKIAQTVGLNVNKFTACLSSGKYAGKVADQLKQAEAAGLRGTPYSIIVSGDKKIPINGAVPEADFKSTIDSLLQ